MATKTDIISYINSQITEIVTIAKHRLSMLSLIDELYPIVYSEKDSSLTNDITAKNTINTNLRYIVYFVKQGKMVYVYGSITNNSSEIIDFSNTDNFFFEITRTEYQTSLPGTIRFVNGNETIMIRSNKFYYSNIPANTTKKFNFHYPAND